MLKFMGQEFESITALKAEFPAFCGDDAIRAIKAGCTTPHEVEVYCYRKSGIYMARKLASSRKHKAKTQPAVKKVKKAAKSRRAA